MPDSRAFVDILKAEGEEDDILKKDIQNLISLLVPVLDQNKEILVCVCILFVCLQILGAGY